MRRATVDCYCCGQPAGYNRAVVDVVTDEEVGGLCVDCERGAFGRTLELGSWGDREGCVLCPRDGHYALPTWDPERVRVDGRVVNRVRYEVDEATPAVCDEHVAALLDVRPSSTSRHAGMQRES